MTHLTPAPDRRRPRTECQKLGLSGCEVRVPVAMLYTRSRAVHEDPDCVSLASLC